MRKIKDNFLRWSPDGCCLALSWSLGAISLWSTFGALLLCTLNWDYGTSPSGDSGTSGHPFKVHTMDWGIEGYHLWMVSSDDTARDRLVQMELVKSPLAANPCMGSKEKLYLHGEDRIYINISDAPSQRTTVPSKLFVFSVFLNLGESSMKMLKMGRY